MLFELRRKDGSIDPYSSGTFIDASGVARHLRREDFSLRAAVLLAEVSGRMADARAVVEY